MIWYVLKDPSRHGSRAYVNAAGSQVAYGPKRSAMKWSSREQAESNACGNEIVEELRT